MLHEVFEEQARRWPKSVAVLCGPEAITYAELDARANRVARHLRERGARRGTSVALLLPRSIEAYVSILGILKAGAAYVPIDPEYPPGRIAWMLEDSGAVAVLTQPGADVYSGDFRGVAIRSGEENGESPEPLSHIEQSSEQRPRPEDLCYVIYTSGSTGRPKGVMVEHRNVCHLVHAEAGIFGVQREDRVYQGAPLSFDLSVEEIWLAFAAGATLVAATPEIEITRQLADAGVTVLSCVPTLLAMLDDSIALPALRLLILGGETCPQHIVERWSRPGRRVVNTYGPTETTVIATYADLSPGRPVTIGRAAPGYRVEILNEHLQPVPAGESGEICIGGPGVARGYLGFPQETRARFLEDCRGARIYRSGDLGRLNADGEIEFIGRADGQVKLRGRRIELGEIESALMRDESVRAAACVVRESDSRIIACVVPRDGRRIDTDVLRSRLRMWLPHWMAPSWIEIAGELPLLANGKLDRAFLSRIPLRSRAEKRPANGGAERKLMEVCSRLLGSSQISADDDFFLDLGCHSLLAARMVSELRNSGGARFASLTLRDVYTWPTISRLAAEVDSRVPDSRVPEDSGPGDTSAGANSSRARHFLCGAAQTASLYFAFAFRGLPWIAPWLVYLLMARHHAAMESALWSVVSAMAVLPCLIPIAICAKWTLLGRIAPGRYPLWGGFYFRWWFVQTLIESLPLTSLGGTPLLPFVYRMFGVRIGKNAHIASGLLAAFDVISIGDGSSIDEGASLLGYAVEGGCLVIGPVSIGRDCLVAARSVLCPGAVMEDGSRLEDLSLLPGGARIPAGETWCGSPARKVFPKQAESMRAPAPGRIRRVSVTAFYAAAVLLFPVVELAAFIPGVAILRSLGMRAALLAGACFILTAAIAIVLLKWLLIGRAKAGRYPVHGWFYVRNWVVEQLLALSLELLGPLHATLFLTPWYRALGAKLGRFAEISNATATTPDLLDIADDCTVADEVSLGTARVERGWLDLARTKLGRRAFVGNSAVIPAGASLGAGSLTGVLTVAPADRDQAAREGACWLGSPPLCLTRRQTAGGFPESSTFRPGRRMQFTRAGWELLRCTLPGAAFVLVTVAVVDAALRLWNSLGPAATLLLLPAIFAACCAAAMLAVIPAKWIVAGRYQPFERPFWSAFVWRLELVNALFEFLATPIGLDALRGTPLLPWYLRMLGCRIGRGVYAGSTGFLEFDLVEIGDRAILNKDCIVQTHLFEDRVLKGARLRIGADCEIGTQSIVLYESEMKDGARLGPLSLLMKGEALPAGPVWTGSPIDNAHAPTAREMVA